MNPQLRSMVDVIVDRSPEELIGCVLLALVLALGLAGLFHLIHRKVSDTSTLIVGLAIGSNLVAMAVAGGYIRYKFIEGNQWMRFRGNESAVTPPGMGMGMGGGRSIYLSGRILQAADLNGDRLLSPDEASFAAAQFVKSASEGGDSPINEERLRAVLRSQLGPTALGMGLGLDGPPPPERPSVGGEERGRRFRRDRERSSH